MPKPKFWPRGNASPSARRACAFRFSGRRHSSARERLGIWSILYDWAHSGSGFPLIGQGNNKYQLMDVEDLCDAI